jgi:hypothetical protein
VALIIVGSGQNKNPTPERAQGLIDRVTHIWRECIGQIRASLSPERRFSTRELKIGEQN